MGNDVKSYHRLSIRMKGYDYSLAGAYFVTSVTKGRGCLFGDVVDNEFRASAYGNIVRDVFIDLPLRYPNIEIELFVIMPNHVHFIVLINDHPEMEIAYCLSEIVKALKSISARRINWMRASTGSAVWQRNYYERIIRNEREHSAIYDYILENPRRWADDEENMGRIPS